MRDRSWLLVLGGFALGVTTAGAIISAIAYREVLLTTKDRWWNDGGLAAWMQSAGALLAIVVAIAIPLIMRWLDGAENNDRKQEESNLTVRLNSELLNTNSQLVRVASSNLEAIRSGRNSIRVTASMLDSISAIMPVDVDDIRLISYSNYALSIDLANHMQLINALKGVIERNRNKEFSESFLINTIDYYLRKIKVLDDEIRNKTY